MKTKIKIILIGLIISSSTFSQNVPNYVPTSGLVGYWGFNGNANDASSNTNHGVVHNASLTSDRYGKVNSAYHFAGNDDNTVSYIATGFKNLPAGKTPRTISVWLTHDTYGVPGGQGNDGHPIIGYGKPQANSDNELFFATTSGNNPYILYGGFTNDLTVDFTYTINTWYHIVASFDGTTAKLYSNNVLIGSSDKSSWNTTLDSLLIGSQPNKLKFHNGKIDEIGIWNRVLTNNEISKLFIGCVTPIATITPASSTTFCQGNSVVLNATTGVDYAYEWYLNNSKIPNETTASLTVNQSGDYSVKIIDGSCNALSSNTTVTVNPNPIVSLNSIPNLYSTDNNITLSGSPVGGQFTGRGVVGNLLSPKDAGLGKKNITYTYTNLQGCSASSSVYFIVSDTLGNICSSVDTLKIKVTFTAGINANNFNVLSVYPNPAKDFLIIDNGDVASMNGYSIKIVDLTGKIIYTNTITTAKTQIAINDFGSKGIYILQVLDSNNVVVQNKKIVLE